MFVINSVFLSQGCISACEEVFSLCSEDVLEDMDNFGRTALHLAALGGHGEVVEILLNRGGINIKDIWFISVSIQCNTIQYSTIQYNTIQYRTMQYNTIHYNTKQYNTIQNNTIQYNTIQYNKVKYNTVQYNTIQCNTV